MTQQCGKTSPLEKGEEEEAGEDDRGVKEWYEETERVFKENGEKYGSVCVEIS